MPVWNPKAIDYNKGLDIVDPKTKKVYTEEEARQQPQEIKSRLIMKARKIGCWVMTAEESRECLDKRKGDDTG